MCQVSARVNTMQSKTRYACDVWDAYPEKRISFVVKKGLTYANINVSIY